MDTKAEVPQYAWTLTQKEEAAATKTKRGTYGILFKLLAAHSPAAHMLTAESLRALYAQSRKLK